ncbi:hypothetical protein FALBO_7296 [Fusarium albosuccineum]|uniref:Uncharacterized protein n=1 Tax=Fusarium albosuccineum TaxID=1237068 RepID=A0A8H4LD62_9HYPO|nr:hypothetical protein FALBO_7296 [Fusarium albosuccineum]
MFSKKKSQEEEPKKEIDLATALPSTDDFRTSLLMTNLSARFSMLREQDDPNTKVGKASDDSVLFPKRQSRMMDFGGFNAGLHDIAEVESIRAPFARSSFQSSDDNASTSGSIMGRSKPIEGNALFGGRQKIYKIGTGGKNGAMSGRVLYDDDVAQSAFQKWRQAEKEKQSPEDPDHSDSFESETARPESPPQPEYNRKRETNSTTSSGPSAARNSTAATSFSSSQPASSAKDSQTFAGTSRTVSPTPPMERSVTRTRRLYEQSMNQDLQDQQTSAFSRIDRIDTLSRRTLGNRTPDLTPTVPSPASATFSDRFVTRSILAKASAPNLRSFSPPASSQMSPVDSANKFSSVHEKTFGGTPPLSPPISETGEAQSLDRSRILGGRTSSQSSRTASQYDETRFAQRQVQMQQGRETPTNRFRAESNASVPGTRSSSSSTHRAPFEKHDSALLKTEPTVQEETQGSTFFDDDDDDQPAQVEPAHHDIPLPTPPQVTVERPADTEHPAFRRSALPTPLSISDRPEDMAASTKDDSPEDSPTLGPTSGGLSGMVRQHLRQDSGASSIYGAMPNEVDLTSRFPPERPDAQAYEPMAVNANAWETIERDLAMSIDGSVTSPTRSSGLMEARLSPPNSARNSKVDGSQEEETDDFARHLADGARRVRERLTSYVEADSTNVVAPTPPVSELPPPPRLDALGILKSKSSRGSLVDRGRTDREHQSQSKAKKLLGLRGSSPAPTSASPRRGSFEFSDEPQPSPEEKIDSDDQRGPEEKENMHVGLKAFRQARRDLQRMKELEVQQRYQGPQKAPARERAHTTSRPPSQERRPPPVTYNRVPSEEARNGGGSRSASRSGSRAPSERDRSGSEASNGGRSGSRPPRLRNGSVPRDDHHGPMGSPIGPNGMPRQGPMLRSPMMPGQDMRRSPHMPPQPYPGGNASPGRFNRPDNNLNIQPAHGYDAGQPSPISPLNGAPSPYGPPGTGPRGPYGGPYSGGMMRNRDMSEPSIMSPTSQMGYRDGLRPGPGFNGGAASTPNLHGNMTAPPLPPINPRRKNTGATLSDATMNAHHLPKGPANGDEHRGGFRSDDDDGLNRQRLRKATSEANGMNVRARSMRHSPPQSMAPPPMPPSMSSNRLPGGMI